MGKGMPVVDLGGLEGEKRKETMAELKGACENWGFFQIVNHGISPELMGKMKRLAHEYHDNVLKPKFQESEVVKRVKGGEGEIRDTDWETCFFVQHLPASNAGQVPGISAELLEVISVYEQEVAKLAEGMLNLLCENLGLEEDYIKKAFTGGANGPFMGTKFAKYPSCPRAGAVKGLRTHTDAGGIILVLQDEVPGLQFLKDGEWVDVQPLTDSIFINTGDQLEVISNGRIKSIPHRVVAQSDGGGRISIATFYNPASDAYIRTAPKLLYPEYTFEQYMKVYSGTKFAEKEPRFEAMKDDASVAAKKVDNGQLVNGVVY